MHISFDSIDELDAFLNWSGRGHDPQLLRTIGMPTALSAPYAPNSIDGRPAGALVPEYAPIAPDEAKTPEQAAQGVNNDSPTELHIPAEPEKRKRRTKAEIQAERDEQERANGLQQASIPAQSGTEPGAAHPEQPANAAVQAALTGTTAQAAAALANVPLDDNPFATLPLDAAATVTPVVADPVEPQASVVPAAGKPTDAADIRTWIEHTAEGRHKNITVTEHIKAGRNFIAKCGMQKYNESFPLVGLDSNIMAYTDDDRALHAAALDFLDWE